MKSQRISWNQKFKWDLLLATAIAILPFLIYLHLLFDRTNNGIIEIFGFTYEHGFADAGIFIWMILSKLIPIALMLIWFHVSAYWWRYFIMIPIALNFYSLGHDCLFYPFKIFGNKEVYALVLAIILSIGLVVYDALIFKRFRAKITNKRFQYPINQDFYNQIIKQLKTIRKSKSNCDIEYSARLMFLYKLLNDNTIEGIRNSKNYMRYTRKRELFFVSILLLTPLLYYGNTFLPMDESIVDFYFFTIEDNGFKSASVYIWFLAGKLCIILPLAIWFYTAEAWWKYAILSPLILYSYQYWEAMQDIHQLDAYGNLSVFPAVFLVITVLIFLSRKFKYKYGLLDMYEEIETELDMLISEAAMDGNKGILQIIKDWQLFSANRVIANDPEYLENLHHLKEEIVYKLKMNS